MTRVGTCLLALILIGAAANTSAHSGTADGLIALARGDYHAAAAILKPIAESDTSPDVAAQFLMATLYEAGRGVPMDRLRACALYNRAATNPESLFGEQARQLMGTLWRAHDNEWFAKCQALANVGFDHRLEPVTFDLAPGHSVEWDIAGATVTFQGRAHTFPWRASRGAAYLPLAHTALRPGGSPPRHFIEVLAWQPAPGRGWALNWQLFEVVRDQVVHITEEGALVTRTDRPAAGDAPDPGTLVALRLDAAGAPEWVILVAGRERRGTIPRR